MGRKAPYYSNFDFWNRKMTQELFILIDIGGTAIKSGLATIDGKLLFSNEIPTEAKAFGGPGIVSKVKTIIANFLSNPQYQDQIRAVAVSTAGMVNPDTCKIVYALPDAIPDYTGVNFKDIVAKEFNLPCTVENDVNCAALGEMWLGGGKGCKDVFCITIGTSIGGAMIVNGNLVSGNSNSAGEIAYMQTPKGILHKVATTTALVKNYAQMKNIAFEKVNGKIIFDAAENGDKEAQRAILELVDCLTDGICNVVCVQNPECIILGGGIMVRDKYLRSLIEASLKEKLRPIVYESTKISFASLENNAGMLGALYNLKQRLKF